MTLADEVKVRFGIKVDGRKCVLPEAMEGQRACDYDRFGLKRDYSAIARDCLAYYTGGSIVEVGCGSGRLTSLLPGAVGVDVSLDMIELGKANFPDVSFRQGSVYSLDSCDYLVCRNALHRFHEPFKALLEMCSKGKRVYIRDLKRDAPWDVIVERVGSRSECLKNDYFGAMAGMFTVDEVKGMLDKIGVEYSIRNGWYVGMDSGGIDEFEEQVEYVCVIG
jgi:SAM-dependent methyltransferase